MQFIENDDEDGSGNFFNFKLNTGDRSCVPSVTNFEFEIPKQVKFAEIFFDKISVTGFKFTNSKL